MPLQLGGVIVHNDSVERITLATRGMTHKYLHLLAVSSSRGEHHGHCERRGQRGHCGQQAVPTYYCSHEPPSTSVRLVLPGTSSIDRPRNHHRQRAYRRHEHNDALHRSLSPLERAGLVGPPQVVRRGHSSIDYLSSASPICVIFEIFAGGLLRTPSTRSSQKPPTEKISDVCLQLSERRSSMANFYLLLSPRTHDQVRRCLLCSPITSANARRAPAAARCKLPERLKAYQLKARQLGDQRGTQHQERQTL